jgi:hypothetical protein
VLKATLWVALAVPIGFAVFAAALQRRDQPYRGQHLSHWVAQRRWVLGAVGALFVAAVMLWAAMGIQDVAVENDCTQLEYEKPAQDSSTLHVAPVSDGAASDNNVLTIYYHLQDERYSDVLRSWRVASSNANKCEALFTHRVTLKPPETQNGEVLYTAEVGPLSGEDTELVWAAGSGTCDLGTLRTFSLEIVKALGLDPGGVH